MLNYHQTLDSIFLETLLDIISTSKCFVFILEMNYHRPLNTVHTKSEVHKLNEAYDQYQISNLCYSSNSIFCNDIV